MYDGGPSEGKNQVIPGGNGEITFARMVLDSGCIIQG